MSKLVEVKHDYLKDLPERLKASFGDLVSNFVMIAWGNSGNGKTSFILQIVRQLSHYGSVLYLSLEEGFSASIQRSAKEHLTGVNNITFADHEMTLENLKLKLSKKMSAKFIVIDSLQYWRINYTDYTSLKEQFPNKTFIFISHQKGSNPDGKTGEKIRYDAGIKVRVEGYVAFVTSRYGGNKPFVIWEDGAKKYWGKKFKKLVER